MINMYPKLKKTHCHGNKSEWKGLMHSHISKIVISDCRDRTRTASAPSCATTFPSRSTNNKLVVTNCTNFWFVFSLNMTGTCPSFCIFWVLLYIASCQFQLFQGTLSCSLDWDCSTRSPIFWSPKNKPKFETQNESIIVKSEQW